jgi:hypothetical protein
MNRYYLGMAIISLVYLTSMFQWSVECCPDDYDTFREWRDATGLAWLVIFPMVIGLLIAQGLIYDLIRNCNDHDTTDEQEEQHWRQQQLNASRSSSLRSKEKW